MELIELKFKLNSVSYELTNIGVIEAMRGILPDSISTYYCTINNIKYPPKQVIEVVLGIGKSEFTSANAVSILRRLGFSIDQEKH